VQKCSIAVEPPSMLLGMPTGSHALPLGQSFALRQGFKQPRTDESLAATAHTPVAHLSLYPTIMAVHFMLPPLAPFDGAVQYPVSVVPDAYCTHTCGEVQSPLCVHWVGPGGWHTPFMQVDPIGQVRSGEVFQPPLPFGWHVKLCAASMHTRIIVALQLAAGEVMSPLATVPARSCTPALLRSSPLPVLASTVTGTLDV
jgi:hypothetical protein